MLSQTEHLRTTAAYMSMCQPLLFPNWSLKLTVPEVGNVVETGTIVGSRPNNGKRKSMRKQESISKSPTMVGNTFVMGFLEMPD